MRFGLTESEATIPCVSPVRSAYITPALLLSGGCPSPSGRVLKYRTRFCCPVSSSVRARFQNQKYGCFAGHRKTFVL